MIWYESRLILGMRLSLLCACFRPCSEELIRKKRGRWKTTNGSEDARLGGIIQHAKELAELALDLAEQLSPVTTRYELRERITRAQALRELVKHARGEKSSLQEARSLVDSYGHLTASELLLDALRRAEDVSEE